MPEPSKVGRAGPAPEDFRHLLALRVRPRRFQHRSETRTRAVGLPQVQHQLLVAKPHLAELRELAATLTELAPGGQVAGQRFA